jgi:hypothetical protein
MILTPVLGHRNDDRNALIIPPAPHHGRPALISLSRNEKSGFLSPNRQEELKQKSRPRSSNCTTPPA